MKPSVAYCAGLTILLTLLLSYIIPSALFLCGGHVMPWLFPLAFIISSSAVYSSSPSGKHAMKGIMTALLTIGAAILICSILSDYSYDGLYYHQEAVMLLEQGWNPIYGTAPEETAIWNLHYAKGLELIAATIVSMTGNIESGKAVNLMLILSCGALTYAFLGQSGISATRSRKVIITIIATCNPIGITQALTYYNDYSKYYLLLLSLILIHTINQTRALRYFLLLAGVIILAIGTKFNIFFEEGLLVFAAVIWFFFTGRRKLAWKLVTTGLAAFVAGGIILGYHPYVTNTLCAGHPLYPLLGEHAIDIMTYNTPEEYRALGRIGAFLLSLVSVHAPYLPIYDSRFAGFGILMPFLLVLCGLVLIRYRRDIPPALQYIAALAFASCFLFEQTWWARYISQLWLIPAITVFAMMSIKPDNLCIIVRKTLILLTLIDIMLCFPGAIYSSFRLTVRRAYIYSRAAGSEVRIADAPPIVFRHLSEHDITATDAALSDLIPSDTIYFYGLRTDTDKYPVIQMPPGKAAEWYHR